jgi:cytochrome c-type biogenesis protein CcmE
MTPRRRRILLVLLVLSLFGIAAAFVLRALDSNIAFYVTPTEIFEGKAPKDTGFRIGGMVKDGSVVRDRLTVDFVLTDTIKDIPVRYSGILPDLFKEGKGAVVFGRLQADGRFLATEVLAKHDENYMPPAAEQAIRQAKERSGSPRP